MYLKQLKPREFKEFSSKDKEKIASLIDDKRDEMIISKAVEDYVYATTRALDAGDYYGKMNKSSLWEHAVNKNSDYFDLTELDEIHQDKGIARYLTFRKAGMYKNHESDRIENSIGLVFDSVFIKNPYEDMHVTTLFGIDKIKAPHISRDLVKYPTRVPVSMGCSITHSVCTCCGRELLREADICECLKFSRGRRKEGKKVAELLRGVDFFELSVVSSPAAPKAYVIDAVSEIIPGRLLKVAEENGMYETEIIDTVYRMISKANTTQEKRRLAGQLDKVISRLEALV
jgi:hypothetical protein